MQPGQPEAAARAAEGNRNVFVNQFAAAAGKDRRQASQACPLLLDIAGGYCASLHGQCAGSSSREGCAEKSMRFIYPFTIGI